MPQCIRITSEYIRISPEKCCKDFHFGPNPIVFPNFSLNRYLFINADVLDSMIHQAVCPTFNRFDNVYSTFLL